MMGFFVSAIRYCKVYYWNIRVSKGASISYSVAIRTGYKDV